MLKKILSAEKYYLFIAVFQIVTTIFFYRNYPYNQVLINNKPVFVPNGITVKDLVKKINFDLEKGDFLDANGGLIRRRGGYESEVFINSQQASFKSRVYFGDNVFFKKGRSKKETIIKQLGLISKDIKISGRGAFLVYVSNGEDGVKLVFRGRDSLKIGKEKIIKQPQATIVKRTDSKGNNIALTFDDGPGEYTMRVISVLKQYDVPATFFVIGGAARRHQDIIKQAVSLGFTIGNHTYSHLKPVEVDEFLIIDELKKTENIIIQAAGVKPKWFRPPELRFDLKTIKISSALGYQIVLATVDPGDYKKMSPSIILGRILKDVRPGAVIVLHDGGGDQGSTVRALPLIINSLRSRGFQFVSLDQLFEKL